MQNSSDYLLSIGLMTGNSLDGADLVLTRFDKDHTMTDLCSISVPMLKDLGTALREVRTRINDAQGDMSMAVTLLDTQLHSGFFDETETKYTNFIADAVKSLIQKAKNTAHLASQYNLDEIDLIGSHGQTCAHCPPSIAKKNSTSSTYTVQIGSGQKLANKTGITVVCDFRSDDLMRGGEGAPLAPIHHLHIAQQIKTKGHFPIAFFNAGNTGNISVISENSITNKVFALGWDAGPFNNFPDKLMQKEKGRDSDIGGELGNLGEINEDLLKILFDKAVVTKDGENFLLRPPPKSSDPTWYQMLPELTGEILVHGKTLSFETRLRTAEYFSAYVLFYTLSFISETIEIPRYFALSGGGWKNPICFADFQGLLGSNPSKPVLNDHKDLFVKIRSRIGANIKADYSEYFGFDGTAMEARIFADAAVSRITGEPFSGPETTGASKEVVAGIIRYPDANYNKATKKVKEWLTLFSSAHLTFDKPEVFDERWSRAAKGWEEKLDISG